MQHMYGPVLLSQYLLHTLMHLYYILVKYFVGCWLIIITSLLTEKSTFTTNITLHHNLLAIYKARAMTSSVSYISVLMSFACGNKFNLKQIIFQKTFCKTSTVLQKHCLNRHLFLISRL